ncbi:MAG TPA: acetylxylan esterase [Membranihabitans sp.]|nr:acetylxylan esterase [Membranihabitans sp.]
MLRSLLSVPIFLLIFLFLGTLTIAQDKRDVNIYDYWPYYGDVSNTLYKLLADRAIEQLEERRVHIHNLKSREDWQQRQEYVSKTLQEIVGPFPPRNPLNPVVTDTLIHEGMVIEKLYFESRPDYYVTAIFCYLEGTTTPLPAIVFCSGHAAEGFRSSTYQTMMFNYVKKGFAVLAFDPIGQGERIRYLDEQGKPRLSPTIEHSYPGTQSFLAGISPANFFIWDGIRSVDYLLTRSEVDPTRIGITGRSGGGTQSAYIAAMDDRIYAAAPECYITTFDKLLKSKGPQDAEQNLISGIARGIDLADYVEVRAPKPTLLVGTTRDIFSIQGFRDVYEEARLAYGAWGVEDHLTFTEDDAGHASTVKNREATYAFFRQHLNNPGPVKDEDIPVLAPEDLWVLPSGNVYRDLGGQDIYSLTMAYLESQEKMIAASSRDLSQKMIEVSGYEYPESGAVVFSGRTNHDFFSMEKYLIQGSGNYYLPVVWMRPNNHNGKTILWIDEKGKEAAHEVDLWLEAGYAIVLPDLSGIGELGHGYKGGDARIQNIPLNVWYAGILTDKSILAVHAEEITLLRSFLSNAGVNKIILLGRGNMGAEVLQTAVMAQWEDPVVVVEAPESFRSILEDREYDARFVMSSVSGSLRYYDLPDLIHALGDQVLRVDPVNGRNEISRINDDGKVIYSTNAQERFEKIKSWLK